MRTTTLATIVLLTSAAAACGGEPPPPPAPPPPPSAAPPPPPPASTSEAPPAAPAKPTLADLVPQTLKNITDAFNAHDAQKFAANFTPDAVDTTYGLPEAHGRDEIAKSVQMAFDQSSDIKGQAARFFSRGNVIAVDWVSAGTMTGDFMGMKATKKPIGGHRLVIGWLNDDGLLTQTHGYVDLGGGMAQMKGAKDAPPVPALPATTEFHYSKSPADDDKLTDWAKAWNETFNKGDAKAVSAGLAPDADVTFYFAGGRTVKGTKDHEKFASDFFKAIPKVQFSVVDAWGIDGFAIIERTATGKLTGRLGPIPPSNKDVTLHICDILQPNADGKVAHGWAYGNMAELAPPPPPPKAAPAAAPKGAASAAPGAGPKPAPAASAAKPAAPMAPPPDKK